MELRKIADAIGIGKYPAVLDEVCAAMPKTDEPACDLQLIDRLQREHNIFGEFYELVRALAIQVNADKNRSTWVKVAVAYAKDRTVAEARLVPVPKADGTAVTAMLPLYILLPQIPMGIESYRRRGFSEEEIASLVGSYQGGIRIVKSQTGMPGVNWLYYYWLTLFVKAAIFRTEGLQFELRTLPVDAVYLKNKQTGQVVPVMNKGTFHRSGEQVLGSVGYEDAAGAFTVQFREDEENYYGHGSFDSKIDPEEKAFPKSQWDCVVRPGEECLSMHIPRGADISREAMDKAIASGYQIARERYPEFKSTAIFCASWLLDPMLAEVLGPRSKIVGFLARFAKYPQKSDGTNLFGYVFPKKVDNYEELPEDTSLQRKLKQLYVDGGHIYYYGGAIIR